MKRIIVIILFSVLLLALVACQSAEVEPEVIEESAAVVEATAVLEATDIPPTATAPSADSGQAVPTELPPTELPTLTETPEPTAMPELVPGALLPDFSHTLTGPFVLGGFSPTYQQDVPEAWTLKAGASQFALSSEEMVEYRVAATSEELKEANFELLEDLADGPKHIGFGMAGLGDSQVLVEDGAVLVTAVYPLATFENEITDPLAFLTEAMRGQIGIFAISNGPEALTLAGFPAAAAIRSGVSGDGVEMTMVTAVVQSNRYLIYMSGYAGSDKFAEQFATLAGMMNSLRILTDELPTDEGTGDSEAGGGETAVTDWATSSSEFFAIDYPANWVGEPFGHFAAWASSEEMAAAVATLFNSDVALAVTNGASALVLVGSYEDFQLPAGTDPITALTDLAAQFTAETGLATATVQAIQEVELNGSPAGYTVVSTELANGQPIKIVMGMVLGETQAARFAGYVLGDDDSAISLLTEMFMTFEFPTAQ